MYDEVVKFFTFFFGDAFDISVLSALFVGFTVMLAYGVIIRPFLNVIGGSNS